MSNIGDLFQNQEQIAEAIQQQVRNFKKDSDERKTPSNIQKRLDFLDSYWVEFEANHEKLKQYEDYNYAYFSENIYDKTKTFYVNARAMIAESKRTEEKAPNPLITIPKSIPEEKTSYQEQPRGGKKESNNKYQSQGNSSKSEELLRKQKSNFKAFSRTIDTINLDDIIEKWEFEDTLRNIESRWKTIDSLHWEIDSEVIENEEEYEKCFEKFEKQYRSIKKAINTRMWSMVHKEKSTPIMELPSFSGTYQDWTSFKDLFTETIHTNTSLSSAQKMQFLKSKVKGEAERLIQHLSITSDNYLTSWEILNNRYNNKKLIFSSHLNTMLNLPNLQYQTALSLKRVHDTTNECLNAIRNLGVNISTWDPILVHLLSQKLDTDTYNDYLESLKQPRELPSLRDFLQFLESKFTSLESARRKQEKPVNTTSNMRFHPTYKAFSTNQNLVTKPKNYINYNNNSTLNKTASKLVPGHVKCPLCNNEHGLFHCNEFIKLHLNDRRKFITKQNLCQNCLFDHKGKQCKSEKKCRLCNEPHHTLLHQDKNSSTNHYSDKPSSSKHIAPTSNSHASMEDISETLLATAQVRVKAYNGSEITLRALIDQGSQVSLISENAAQLLKLPRHNCKGVIFGVGAKENNCKGGITITCTSMNGNYTFNSDMFVMRNLINNLPNKSFAKPSKWKHLEGLQLADPEFYISKPVDILFGADVYSNIILGGIIKGDEKQPIAQQSLLGWILCGNMRSYQCNVIINNLDEISKFWQMEDIPDSPQLSLEDQYCIQRYQTTTLRQEDGRYIVRLPLHPDIDEKLGESRPKAAAQFFQLEKKFQTSIDVANEYKLFMAEYEQLSHMELCNRNMKPAYYLPHHCVQRADSLTTKLRVVFNASAKTNSGQSLNDLMYSGPNLQTDLPSIILKWRLYEIAFTADLEKMFRQILCHEDDRKYQTLLWRDNPEQPIQDYVLTTVTYGTKAAPFLAMMTLKQLAKDEKTNYPEVAPILETSFYMDDLLYSTDSIETAKRLKENLINLLKTGGFNLRKWSSNYPELTDEYQTKTIQELFNFRHQESTKALGLRWNPNEDIFAFTIPINIYLKNVTKRMLLSEISKIFDPLGWLSPVTTKLKLLFQQIWQDELRWDDEVPEPVNKEWSKIKTQLPELNDIKIPRWLKLKQNDNVELHGFCDASEKAYACVIYCRANEKSVTIVAAKSRLVPAKKTISLPKLELSAALLLSNLMKKVEECFVNHEITLYGWSDSTAVLGWLHGDQSRWKTFVSNRVAKITTTMPSKSWNYVKSSDNPADCASRGIHPSQLKEHPLWWRGPHWLLTFQPETEKKTRKYETNEEVQVSKQTNVIVQRHKCDIIDDVLTRNSCLTRVIRVIAWILRAVSGRKHRLNYLTATELRNARNIIIKHIQFTSFEPEIEDLEKKSEVNVKSKLLPLKPYLDTNGLLRVGGRIVNANISDEQKHPIIIPHDGHYTNLLIDDAHIKTFHGGARLTLATLRKHYWIIGGNRAVKKRLRGCVKCRRHNPVPLQQLMGDLPAARCNPTRPFYHTGVDYTGYVDVKTNKGRGVKTTKGYIAVFVCMVTKAAHLELVSDLTSTSFLSALRRLAARRGSPRHMYSDNGTNFVGASKILEKDFLNLTEVLDHQFLSTVADMNIEWHFNAPSWPSAGGLWEAAVKSLKYHLRRVIGEQKLTFEEFSTLLAQLEACLNSRPLSALTEDPEDVDYLTPSHFLSSGPTLTIYETETNDSKRWQLIQKIQKDIWIRWQSEYLSQLSTRSKWRQAKENLKIDDIVVIHEDNLPPGKWALGRILEVHPGKDGFVRVVTVKTKNGTLKRPVTKLSILPVTKQSDSQPEKIITNKQGQDQQKEPTEKSRKRGKVKTICNVIWAFISFFSLILPAQCTYSLMNIKNNQSIYFDKITDMRMTRDEWKLIVYYDMEPYWHGIEIFQTYINNLEKLCTSEKREQCDVILLQLRHGVKELHHYSEKLLNQQLSKTETRRRRRGLINGVGYLAHSLFGVLDEEFAQKYEKDIDLIRGNERHLLQLWKNQTSIVEAENNLLKRIEQANVKQHKMFNQHLIDLNKAVNTMAIEMNEMKKLTEFTLTSIIANNIFGNIKNIQETLLDTITDIHYGKFNIHLLSPQQLTKELNIISGQLSKELTLPIDNIQTDLSKIYHFLTVKARMTLNYFIFEIKIPLVTRDNYEIYKLIAVPQLLTDDKMVNIVPISDYIALSLRKDSYIPLSETDLKACTLYDYENFMCLLRQPIYHLQSDENLCIKIQETNRCQTKQSVCTDLWTQLNEMNTYLYFCCGELPIRIICEHHVTAERVSKAGIIKIRNGCVIKGDAFTIHSHTQQTSTLTVKSDVLKVNIPAINNIFNISIPNVKTEYGSTVPEEQFNKVDKQIQQLKSAENTEILSNTFTTHDVHQYIVMYLLAGAGLFAAGIYIWKRARSRCTATLTRSMPATQQQDNAEREIPLSQLPPVPLRHTAAKHEIPDKLEVEPGANHTYSRVDKSTSPVNHKLFYDINSDNA